MLIMNNSNPTRYSAVLVTLHWTLAILIIANLFIGHNLADNLADTDPAKISSLKTHMLLGGLIFFLMCIRLLVRINTDKPAPVSTDNAFLDKLAVVVQYSLYACVFLMCLSGFTLAMETQLPQIVSGDLAKPLPPYIKDLTIFMIHGATAIVLTLLMMLHIAGALYHQFVLKDHLISRMSYGDRYTETDNT
jgi:cytochrome b561